MTKLLLRNVCVCVCGTVYVCDDKSYILTTKNYLNL